MGKINLDFNRIPAGVVSAALVGGLLGTLNLAGLADAADGKFTIYVSNNYIGNPWRAQMVNAVQAVAARPEYKDKVEVVVVNSENTVTSQTASLQTIIRKKPSGILIDAASATALNPTVEAACAEGIVVYTFDQTLTAPCAVQVRQDDKLHAENMAHWLAAAIGEKGDVLVDEGIPGAPSSVVRTEAYKSVLGQYPGINIVGTYIGNGAPGPELQQVSALLASHRDVVGVVTEGYCSAVFQAFQRASLPPPACASLDTAISAKTCVENDMACYLWAAPSWVGAYAFVEMMKHLEGGPKPKEALTDYANDYYVTQKGAIKFEDDPLKQVLLEAGKTYFPDSSDQLILPVTGAGLNITVEEALNGAQ